jgi:flagellar M-ring protein FliF
MNKNPLSQLLGIFNRLAMPQKIMIGAVTVGTVVLLGVLVGFLNEPNMAVLYTNLGEDDASKVVEQLTSQKIAYKIEDNGKTIKVPQEVVYETRLSLAGKGIPNSGIIGYEIFDKNTMGMSEFIQKLNYKRALEGELARTIMQVDGVDAARVHIVIPEKSIFKDEEKQTTASVVLKLKSGNSLPKESVTSILNLVSSSVEGLEQNKISLLDSRGRLLSKNEDENSMIVATSKQYELKQSVEKYLIQKAQGMLDNVLGVGSSIVQITTDLNFDQVEKQMEQYDPETQVAISEQTLNNENSGKNNNDSSSQNAQNTTTNYEVSKTIQKVIEGTGNIKRISVAAVINDAAHEVNSKGKKTVEYQPRSQEQLNKLEQIVKNAVGFDVERGDNFSLVNIPFEQTLNKDLLPEETEDSGIIPKDVDKWTNLILILGAIGASLLVMKGLMKKLKTEKIVFGGTYYGSDGYSDAGGMQPALEGGGNAAGLQQLAAAKKKRAQQLPEGDIEDEFSEEAIRKQTQQNKISHYVAKNPMEAAKLINSWLQDNEY